MQRRMNFHTKELWVSCQRAAARNVCVKRGFINNHSYRRFGVSIHTNWMNLVTTNIFAAINRSVSWGEASQTTQQEVAAISAISVMTSLYHSTSQWGSKESLRLLPVTMDKSISKSTGKSNKSTTNLFYINLWVLSKISLYFLLQGSFLIMFFFLSVIVS